MPGLVLACLWRRCEVALVESNGRRAAFLREAAAALSEVSDYGSIRVVGSRAEEVGHSEFRSWADVVTARGFGSPSVTAECAAPLLTIGGILVVSEPPDSDGSRWSPEGLALLGLGGPLVVAAEFRYALIANFAVSRPVPPEDRRSGEEAALLGRAFPSCDVGCCFT